MAAWTMMPSRLCASSIGVIMPLLNSISVLLKISKTKLIGPKYYRRIRFIIMFANRRTAKPQIGTVCAQKTVSV